LPHDHWRRVNDGLDPRVDHVAIYRNLVMHEFPWDMNQALSFALFRTYAVPGIGGLLGRTGEFTERVQKRYDDTALLLERPTRLGFEHPETRAALRRINAMHRMYDIPDHEFRYVLSTFVVVPRRWIDVYGKRRLTPTEVDASVHYYRELARHLGIGHVPETYDGFAALMDGYEAEHFGYDEDARRVADATLGLMLTFHPRVAAPAVEVFARAMMDPPLRAAFRYDDPPALVERLVRGGLKARGVALRAFPARRRPKSVEDLAWVRSYPDGHRVEELGVFAPAPGCPVRSGGRRPR
jgi:hypothetical protein